MDLQPVIENVLLEISSDLSLACLSIFDILVADLSVIEHELTFNDDI